MSHKAAAELFNRDLMAGTGTACFWRAAIRLRRVPFPRAGMAREESLDGVGSEDIPLEAVSGLIADCW